MGPVSTITRNFQKAIDLVVNPEDPTEDRGHSPSSLRRRFSLSRTNSTQRSTESTSKFGGRSRTKRSPGPARVGGRPVHLLADSPPGSERHTIRVSSTRRRSGSRRSLQESLNSKVDTSNPPPVPTMPPRWQEVINAIRGEKKGALRTEHEKEARANFEKLKNKRWDDLSPAEKAKEERNHIENKKRLKAWDLEKDINRQTRRVQQADEEAEEKAREAASAKRRLERLKRRKEESGRSTPGSPKTGKRTTKLKKPEGVGSDEDPPSDPMIQNREGSNRKRSLQQVAESGQASNAPSLSRQPQEFSNSPNRRQPHRSSTAPISAAPSKGESAVPQRPSQIARSSTAPISAVPSKGENVAAQRPSQNARSITAPSSQQRSRPNAESNSPAPAMEANGGSGAQVPSRTVAGRSTTQQPLQLSQLRQVSNANEVESNSSRQPASSRLRTAREEESKLQKECQVANRTVKPSQRPQTVQNRRPGESRAQQQQSQSEKKSKIVQPSRTKRTTLALLTEENLKSTNEEFIVESASAFDVQTELDRGIGDNMRTVLERLVPMTPAELAEEDEKRKDAARQALEEAERREQEKILATQFNRGLGNNMRTYYEAMVPMTSEDIRVEERKWKSNKRQQLDAEEEAEQAKLVQTELNRGLGNMMRTNLEGMVPMTPEEVKQELREKLEQEERRLQDELLKTKFNRGPGDNMRTILEGMTSKNLESMTPEEVQKRKQAQSQRKSAGTSRYTSES